MVTRRIKTISIDGYKWKLTLLKGIIQENDFVVSISRFERMDKFGNYINLSNQKEESIEIEKVSLININSVNSIRIY